MSLWAWPGLVWVMYSWANSIMIIFRINIYKSALGGSSLYIESVLESSLTPKSTPGLSKTGQLGDVMKESTSIAYTYAKSLMATKFPENKFFEKARVHLHCPAGAVPKDGESLKGYVKNTPGNSNQFSGC